MINKLFVYFKKNIFQKGKKLCLPKLFKKIGVEEQKPISDESFTEQLDINSNPFEELFVDINN